ncbi:unnamed protein product [Acanthoscelides obtectus]|uniref:Uncharacterized protein n=1 Tax=Acanthoscelides obtectus TaxID=200917 RepID=A0A9P0KZU0_ACAOB|nr:unnamed protein product [Acanthoscelides obtectus]CAK1662225.1 hypothetical protein AOBTE_LOCUS23043 [Acanthoscelides obtectus]
MVLTRETCEEIKNLESHILTNSLNDPTFITKIAGQVAEATAKTVSKKLETMERNLSLMEKSIAEFKTRTEAELSKMRNQIKVLHQIESRCDNIDQRLRKNNLRIFNLAEDEKENTREKARTFPNSKLSIDLQENDIEIYFRVGKAECSKQKI